ncbi:MAG: S23 ribosomal protein [Candidatus Berkelbacteria bacterium Licking1014_7]|uniref:S23 ribosomal protein n=1 Tax=Candidatus Berkelbacteria bacterium Licking1014_7 TaxID=2017147 RepID=A0A554LKY9_9BACT|nr:MAG: S23 ribosomal protein [Candidatus Berkelbacteria bacterium Licking1014_7]
MAQIQNSKHYDLEDRTYKFAKECRDLSLKISKNFASLEYARQLIRSSSSTAANYIEANEAISRKDFVHRIKICRKEARESKLWLNLISIKPDSGFTSKQNGLVQESIELQKIFGAIIEKCKKD